MARFFKTSKPAAGPDKDKPTGEKPPQGKSSGDKAGADKPHPRPEGARETVESIVVAFILAFLVRTFEAEAFVIPTGSMAPTLRGRNIEFDCAQCGTHSVVGASSELDRDTEYYEPSQRIVSALCPNCRYSNPIFDPDVKPRGMRVFNGDRILVNKFPYDFWQPERWDVVVFKYPENPRTNYIKRLVGLPGEEIMIEWGDVYVRKEPKEPFRIARKDDPYKQRVLQMLVYNNNRPAREFLDWGWPERWSALKPASDDEGDWTADDAGWQADFDARTFQIDAAEGEPHWIRYRHFVPSQDDWEDFEAGRPLEEPPRPRLISDFCPYNAYTQRGGSRSGRDDALWVGDLTANFDVEIQSPQGELLLELVEGAYRYRCRIDLETGAATLFYLDTAIERPPHEEHVLATAETPLNESGRFSLSFANVDRRLCLWIDDALVEFDRPTEYGRPALPAPQQADLAPVGIAAAGSQVKVSNLVLQRDVYYRSDAAAGGFDTQYEYGGVSNPSVQDDNYRRLRALMDDPAAWYKEFAANQKVASFEPLGPDEFFMMGDNSPHSQDSRLWPNQRGAEHRHAVPRSALVGKAFFVYWPHGEPFMNDGRGYAIPVPPFKRFTYHEVAPGTFPSDLNPPREPYPKFTIPFYPDVPRMHRIR